MTRVRTRMYAVPKVLLVAIVAIACAVDARGDIAHKNSTLSSPTPSPSSPPPSPSSPILSSSLSSPAPSSSSSAAAAASSSVSASSWPHLDATTTPSPKQTLLRGASTTSARGREKPAIPPIPPIPDSHAHAHAHRAHPHTDTQHAHTQHTHTHVRVDGQEEHHTHAVHVDTDEDTTAEDAVDTSTHAPADTEEARAPPAEARGGGRGHAEGSVNASRPYTDLQSNTVCFDGSAPLVWTSEQHQVKVNGRVFQLKGVNWFGFETQAYTLHGLDVRPMDEYLQFLKQNNFNALRIPFSLAFVQSYYTRNWGNYRDQDMNGMTRRDQLHKLIQRAGDFGMLVMLDMHRLNDQFISQLWYSDQYSEAAVIAGWDTILGDTMGYWNLFAVDLKNEPYGVATWGNSNPATDWNHAAERMAKYLLGKYGDKWKGLIFVEGIGYSHDLTGWWQAPIDFGKPAWNQRMVLSPHQYGPSVASVPDFYQPNFPNNMPAIWDKDWGFLRWATDRAVVVGEWGGRYTGLDRIWGDRFVPYLVDNCFSSQFYWCLNPDSGDTGGLLQDDWYTPEWDKLNQVARVQPNPSWLTKTNGQICFSPGSYANPQCASRNRARPKRMPSLRSHQAPTSTKPLSTVDTGTQDTTDAIDTQRPPAHTVRAHSGTKPTNDTYVRRTDPGDVVKLHIRQRDGPGADPVEDMDWGESSQTEDDSGARYGPVADVIQKMDVDVESPHASVVSAELGRVDKTSEREVEKMHTDGARRWPAKYRR